MSIDAVACCARTHQQMVYAYDDRRDEVVHVRLASDPLRTLCDRYVTRDLPYLPLDCLGNNDCDGCRRCRRELAARHT